MSNTQGLEEKTFPDLDQSINGLGLTKHYQAYLISIVSNKMISDSLKGKSSEDGLVSVFCKLIAKEMAENKFWLKLQLSDTEQELVKEHSKLLSQQAATLVEDPNYKTTSKNKTIAFILELGERLVNSIRVLTDSIIVDEYTAEETHHILIQIKSGCDMWLFDMTGDNINYKDVNVFINGINSPALKEESVVAVTSFFKFLAVCKGRDLALRRSEKLNKISLA